MHSELKQTRTLGKLMAWKRIRIDIQNDAKIKVVHYLVVSVLIKRTVS